MTNHPNRSMRRPRIDVVHGSQFASAEDRARALDAAARALAEGKSHEEAEMAANLALTEGWHNVDGAHCELIACP